MVRICKNNRYHHSIQTTITWIFESNERIWIGDIFSFWWSLGCAPSRRLGTFIDCSIFHMLRCFRFALHQKDISGGSRSPEVRPRCIGRRITAAWRWWSCSSRRRPRWLWKTTKAGGLGWEMWWAFDGFCFRIWFYCIATSYHLLHLITVWRLFCYRTLRLPVVSSQSVKVS